MQAVKFNFPEATNQQKVFSCISALDEKCREFNLQTPEDVDFYFSVYFDINSVRMAGQACYRPAQEECFIRLHPKALEHYGFDTYKNTVIHEYAHIIVYINYPRAKAHGREFKRIFRLLGGNGERCHTYDLRSLVKKATRKQVRINYSCSCQNHMITTTKHNKIVNGARYICRSCKTTLVKA